MIGSKADSVADVGKLQHHDNCNRLFAQRPREVHTRKVGFELMSSASPLVLIVDDEKDLCALLEFNLRQAGFRTTLALSGREALDRARTAGPDLMILDLNLPDISGFDICRQIKADSTTQAIPIIMLTARIAETDRIKGFELGADDYVPKPFSLRELVWRVNVAMRRRAPGKLNASGGGASQLSAGPIQIDLERFITRVDGKDVSLALREFKLLVFLIEAQGRVRTREELFSQVWGYPVDSDSRTIETHIKRLREKLRGAGDLIETVRSIGYRMRSI